MKLTQERIQEISEHGYNLDYGQTFEYAFKVYKKTFLTAGLTFLIFGFVVFIITLGAIFSTFDYNNPGESMKSLGMENPSITFTILLSLSGIIIGAILSPLTAGFIKMNSDADRELPISVGTIFYYFRSPYYLRIAVATLIMSCVISPFSFAIQLFINPAVGFIFAICIQVFTILVVPLIIFGGLNSIDAIRGSFIVTSKKPFQILFLIIVGYLFSFCGILGCCIGMFFTLPILYSIYYSIYSHSVGFPEIENQEETDRLEF